MSKVTRRSFVTTIGAAAAIPAAAIPAAALLPPAAHTANAPTIAESDATTYLFFNAAEALFVEAACERLIPADESGPGAQGTGVANYLDRQLGGAFGAGERLYRCAPSIAISRRAARPSPTCRATPRIPISSPWKPAGTISMECLRPSSSGC